VAGIASLGGLAEQRWEMSPKRVRGTARCGFVFDPGTCLCQNIKCSGLGSRYGGGEPVRASSEAETRARGCLALERGGVSPKGETSPRARQNLTRWGGQPLSEADPHLRGRPALERGGTSPEGTSSPSSEAESR
jgi:hypothetical protein